MSYRLPWHRRVHLSYQYNTNQVLEVVVEAAGQRSEVSVERNTGVASNEIPAAADNLGELKIE